MDFLSLSNISTAEIKNGLDQYLSTLDPAMPNSLTELLTDGGIIYSKFESYKDALEAAPPHLNEGYREHVARRQQLRTALEDLMATHDLDALFYLHNLYAAQFINEHYDYTKVRLSSVSGLPAIVVPGGYTSDNLPVGVEFLTAAFDEPKLLSLAYAYEQSTRHRRNPPLTPPLKSDFVKLP